MIQFITIIGGILSAVITGYLGFFFAKSKYLQEVEKLKVEVLQAKKDAETTDINNDDKIIQQYRSALDDLPARYESKFNDLIGLFEQKERILKEEINFLKKERDLWRRKYNELFRQYKELKKQLLQ